MKLVVDANAVFSTLIKDGKTADILLSLAFDFYTPEFILDEFGKHEEEILLKSHRLKWEFADIFNKIKQIITIIPSEEFDSFISQAKEISPDHDDVMYFALALKLNSGIWSNDKKLKLQDKVKIFSTKDLIDLLNL